MNSDRFKHKEIIETGLLLNFGRKPEFKRFVFDNKRKSIGDNLPATLSPARRAGQRKPARHLAARSVAE
jgi:hypothetical protein